MLCAEAASAPVALLVVPQLVLLQLPLPSLLLLSL
jgi:hypothetical protein